MTAAGIRKELVLIKISGIRESVDLVRSHLPARLDEFVTLGLIKDGIYKRIEYAVELVLDICAVINADLKLGVPGEDEDVLVHLQANAIISEEMADRIRKMRAFRNIVVHRCGAIDDAIAFSLLQDRLGDFDLFCSEVGDFIAGEQETG